MSGWGHLLHVIYHFSLSLSLISCNFSSVDEQIKAKYASEHNYNVFCGSVSDMGLYLLPPTRRLCFHSCPFVIFGWFVSRVTQKLLTGFPWNLDRGWVLAQNRQHQLLVGLQIEGRAKNFFLAFFYIARWGFLKKFSSFLKKQCVDLWCLWASTKRDCWLEVCTLLNAILVHSVLCPLMWDILNKIIGLHLCYCAPATWNDIHNWCLSI